ncbi:MAG: DUF3267 domain-containing protein [Clostridia bacterium]|nr:DUF3267 domain-containing protein [Clostridia bacterium]
MKRNNFEKELPEGYTQVYHLNAKNVKVGLIFNLIAAVIMIAVIIIAAIPVFAFDKFPDEFDFWQVEFSFLAAMVLLLVYLVLHELTHGAAYKIMTGEKLKFGVSWSCAFCGVPDIYTYRKTALVALLAPFCLFSVILIPLTCVALYISIYIYFVLVLVLASHLGGCIGDIFVTILLSTKYRNKALLMRDTGPEQFFYLPTEKENHNA